MNTFQPHPTSIRYGETTVVKIPCTNEILFAACTYPHPWRRIVVAVIVVVVDVEYPQTNPRAAIEYYHYTFAQWLFTCLFTTFRLDYISEFSRQNGKNLTIFFLLLFFLFIFGDTRYTPRVPTYVFGSSLHSRQIAVRSVNACICLPAVPTAILHNRDAEMVRRHRWRAHSDEKRQHARSSSLVLFQLSICRNSCSYRWDNNNIVWSSPESSTECRQDHRLNLEAIYDL